MQAQSSKTSAIQLYFINAVPLTFGVQGEANQGSVRQRVIQVEQNGPWVHECFLWKTKSASQAVVLTMEPVPLPPSEVSACNNAEDADCNAAAVAAICAWAAATAAALASAL